MQKYIFFCIIYHHLTLFQKKGLLSVKGIVCYVCGNEEFLPPLEVEEEKELLVRKEVGDSLATEKLIEHNLRLVAYIARKFDNANIDYVVEQAVKNAEKGA